MPALPPSRNRRPVRWCSRPGWPRRRGGATGRPADCSRDGRRRCGRGRRLLLGRRAACRRCGGRFLLCLLDGRLRHFLGQLALHLVQGRLRRRGLLLVGLRERLRLRRLRWACAASACSAPPGSGAASPRLQQRGLVLGQIADDLIGVLVARLVQRRRRARSRRRTRSRGCRRRTLPPRRWRRAACRVARRLGVDQAGGDRLERRLRVLQVLLARCCTCRRGRRSAAPPGQGCSRSGHLRLGGVDLRLIRRRTRQRRRRRGARVRRRPPSTATRRASRRPPSP